MSRRPVRIAIVGGSGYGAGELLRLLTQHPQAEVTAVVSRGAGVLGDWHPHLRGFYDALRPVAQPDWRALLDAEFPVVISAQPHGGSAARLVELGQQVERDFGAAAAQRVKWIDLSGDLRLRDAQQSARHYPETPALAEWRAAAAYGLPELSRAEVRTARIVANPGCLATACILAGAPLMTRAFAGPVALDAKTGSSGAGRELKDTTHHPTRHADFRAYKPLAHQHEPEILQAWGDAAGARINTSFVAQSMDAVRGIFVTLHAQLPEATTTAALRERFASFYRASPFVRIVDGSPLMQTTIGSNFCDIGLAARGRQVIVMAALDNLVKGMSGAAIQNMNLMCGLDETTGLWVPAVRPV